MAKMKLDVDMLKRYSVFCLVLFFLALPFCAGQDIPAVPTVVLEPETQTKSVGRYKIGVNVNEAILDVVVVDEKGRPIKDLTTDDFEIYQDNRRQTVTSSVYIDNKSGTAAWNERKDAPNLPQFSARAIKEEEIRRTILFFVYDLSLADGVPKAGAVTMSGDIDYYGNL